MTYYQACLEAQRAAEAQQAAARAEEDAKAWAVSPYRYFREDKARSALLAARVPAVEIFDVTTRSEPNKWPLAGILYDQSYHDVGVATRVGTGWILDEFPWDIVIPGTKYYEPDPAVLTENWLTALVNEHEAAYLPAVRSGSFFSYGGNGPLIRVRSHSRGYERLRLAHDCSSCVEVQGKGNR